jgi:phosphatidate cytidylyltransferase
LFAAFYSAQPLETESLPSTAPQVASAEAQKKKYSDLRSRVITGLLAAPTILAIMIYVPNGWGLMFFCVVVGAASMHEYLQMSRIAWKQPIAIATVGIALSLLALASAHFQFGIPLVAYYPLVILVFPLLGILVLFEKENNRPFQQIGLLLASLFYLLLPLLLYFISGFRLGEVPFRVTDLGLTALAYEYDWQRPIGVLFLLFGADTGAYFAGKAFGKHKIWPRISPGKSWEGAAGGMALAVGAGAVFNLLMPTASCDFRIVGAIIMVFGLFGDLLESLLKRTVHKKDSGNLLPGHGGLLDRFDGFFIAMPFVSLYFYWLAV